MVSRRALSTLAVGMAMAALTTFAADQGPTNTTSHDMLLTDSLGRTVKVPTNEVPQGFQPPATTGLKHQFANPSPGARTSVEVLRRIEEAHEGLAGIQIFPGVPPLLPSYLFGLDEYGNTLVAPGALIDLAPFEPPLQAGKYWLSDYGLRYSLQQTLSYVNMSDVIKGANILGYYTLDFKGKWSVFDAPAAGTAGWIELSARCPDGPGRPLRHSIRQIQPRHRYRSHGYLVRRHWPSGTGAGLAGIVPGR